MKRAFNGVGWFIPTHVFVDPLNMLVRDIEEGQGGFGQRDLEAALARINSPRHLAAMVIERYATTPHISDYKVTISEAIRAHFLGLHHVAVAGLLPVIEGAAKRIAQERGLPYGKVRPCLHALAKDCKKEVIEKKIGAVGELISMLDAFADFADKHLYVGSETYSLEDKTNRNGILHGAYADADYGQPINFFKVIGAIDFLCLVAGFRARLYCFAPDESEQSKKLAEHYLECARLAQSFEANHNDPAATRSAFR
jgi:hypothetical protein